MEEVAVFWEWRVVVWASPERARRSFVKNGLAVSGWATSHLWGVLDAAPILSANFPKVRLPFNLNFLHQSVKVITDLNECLRFSIKTSKTGPGGTGLKSRLLRMSREDHKFRICLGCRINSRLSLPASSVRCFKTKSLRIKLRARTLSQPHEGLPV